jgi:hypothetical protein
LGCTPTESHLNDRHSDLFRNAMDYLEYGCLAGSGAATENTKWEMDRHLHSLSLPGVQSQPCAFLKAGYCFRSDRRQVA